jgi:predicted RNA methylase
VIHRQRGGAIRPFPVEAETHDNEKGDNMNTQSNVPALPRSVWDILEEYERKSGELAGALEHFTEAATALETASSIAGTYSGSIWQDGRYSSAPRPKDATLRAALLKSAWRAAYKHLRIDRIAPAHDRKAFDMSLENPPELTADNLLATFGDYVGNQRFHLLRGLAETFCNLDPAYKSHSKVKIGVSGLPKRIILASVGIYGSWGYDRFKDTLTALALYRAKPHPEHREIADLIEDANKHGASYWNGVEIRKFQNGNAHLIFDAETLREINLALAEFYGDVLPDSPEEAPKKRTGTAVSKDLAYYPTPHDAAQRLISGLNARTDGLAILEPSCGDGRLMDALRAANPTWRLTGCEVHPERADQAHAKGHHVITRNFLETAANPVFDAVVMNPPFCGRHWRKHIDHARKFLKPDGRLFAILPASAYYDGHLDDLVTSKTARGYSCQWEDLPIASFRESGTNIGTGIFNCGAA